jgi:hypothetical protein
VNLKRLRINPNICSSSRQRFAPDADLHGARPGTRQALGVFVQCCNRCNNNNVGGTAGGYACSSNLTKIVVLQRKTHGHGIEFDAEIVGPVAAAEEEKTGWWL